MYQLFPHKDNVSTWKWHVCLWFDFIWFDNVLGVYSLAFGILDQLALLWKILRATQLWKCNRPYMVFNYDVVTWATYMNVFISANSWFLAAAGTLATKPDLFREVVLPGQSFDNDYAGENCFKLLLPGMHNVLLTAIKCILVLGYQLYHI